MNHNEIEKIVDGALEVTIGKTRVDDKIINEIINNASDEMVYVPAGFKYREMPTLGVLSIIISIIIICSEIVIAKRGLFSKAKDYISILIIALVSAITGILSGICLKNSYREEYYDHRGCGCMISSAVEISRFYMYIVVAINILLVILMLVKIRKYCKLKKGGT